MTEIVDQFALSDISVTLLLEIYRDFNRIAQILTNQPISTAIAELLRLRQRYQRYLAPICSSAFEFIQRLITDEQFRDDVLAQISLSTIWIWKQIIVRSTKVLLVQYQGYWTSLKEIVNQYRITNQDHIIRYELEEIEYGFERLRQIVSELDRLINQLEMSDDEDTVKHGELFESIETKLQMAEDVLQSNEKIIKIDELKEFILKYQEEQRNANGGYRIMKAASAIGTVATFVYPPVYFFTAAVGTLSACVFSSLLSSCTADKVEELSQKLTLLEEYKRKYAETMQEIEVLKDKKEQVAVDKLTNLAARLNLNANKNDGCACGCKCQQV